MKINPGPFWFGKSLIDFTIISHYSDAAKERGLSEIPIEYLQKQCEKVWNFYVPSIDETRE